MKVHFKKIYQKRLPEGATKKVRALAREFKMGKSSYAEVWEEKGVVYISTSYGLLTTDYDLLKAQKANQGTPARKHPGSNATGHWLPASGGYS